MVLIHIICHDREQALEIVDFLIDEKLVLDAMVSEKLLFKKLTNGETESHDRILVMGSTKALLFKTINDRIRKRFKEAIPLLYAMPIIYMDENQTLELQTETQKV